MERRRAAGLTINYIEGAWCYKDAGTDLMETIPRGLAEISMPTLVRNPPGGPGPETAFG